MHCRDFQILISARLDGEIRPSERALLNHHLNGCAACRHYEAELREQSLSLQNLRAQQTNLPNLQAMQQETMWALQIEARKQLQKSKWRAEQKLNWRIKLFSGSFAVVMSSLLFFTVITAVLRPAQQALSVAKVAAQTVLQTAETEDNEAQLKDLLLPLPPSPRPILDPRGTLIGFTKEVRAEDFAVIAMVEVDGTAEIKQVIEAPQNPQVISKLSTALAQQANFKPAYRRGKFTPANTILMFSQVTIIG